MGHFGLKIVSRFKVSSRQNIYRADTIHWIIVIKKELLVADLIEYSISNNCGVVWKVDQCLFRLIGRLHYDVKRARIPGSCSKVRAK